MFRLSTVEIADLIDELDDSDLDPDFEGDKKSRDMDSSSSSGSDDELVPDVPLRGAASSGPEQRIYMEPPVERADADTDHDSGEKT